MLWPHSQTLPMPWPSRPVAVTVDGASVRAAPLWMPRNHRQANASPAYASRYARGVGRQVGLVHRDRGQAEPPGHGGAVRTQEDRAGQVHDLGPVPNESGPDLAAGQAEPEARVAGQRHRGNMHDRERERGSLFPAVLPFLVLFARTPLAGPPGCDDEGVVAVAGEEFGDP